MSENIGADLLTETCTVNTILIAIVSLSLFKTRDFSVICSINSVRAEEISTNLKMKGHVKESEINFKISKMLHIFGICFCVGSNFHFQNKRIHKRRLIKTKVCFFFHSSTNYIQWICV